MSGAKLVGLAILGLLLFGVVGAANVVTTADRTALNGEYVTDQMESSGSYEAIRDSTVDQVVDRVDGADFGEGERLLQSNETDSRALVSDAVTEDYVREQTNENVLALYDYLNGRSSSLGMELDLVPLKENLAESFVGQLEQKNTGTLIDEFGPSEEETPVPVTGDLVRKMRAGPVEYEEARLDFRVDVVFAATTNDQKLLLIGEDPRQYSESEKERIVQNREPDIRAEMRQQLDSTPDRITVGTETIDVANRIDTRRADAKQQVCETTRQELNASDGSELCGENYQATSDNPSKDNVTNAAVQLQYVIVDGLTDEAYTYDQFDTDLTDSENEVSNETADLVESRIEEQVPDTLSAEEQFGEDATTQLENAQGAVGTLNTLALVVPVLALLLVVVTYAASRSLETTATVTGIALALAGGLMFVAASALGATVLSRVESAIEDAGASQFTDVAVALVEGVLSTLATQSTILLVVGIVLIALAYASNKGLVGGLGGTATASGGGSGPQQDPQGGNDRGGQN
jgi:hypothetical protein